MARTETSWTRLREMKVVLVLEERNRVGDLPLAQILPP
jgi:hypothetical protein